MDSNQRKEMKIQSPPEVDYIIVDTYPKIMSCLHYIIIS